jgi:hypothetical protein
LNSINSKSRINPINSRDVHVRRKSCQEETADPEETEGQVLTAESLKIRISEVLNVGVEKREDLGKSEDLEKIRDLGKKGDPEKTGGNLFQRTKKSVLDFFP